ncbi:MAG: DUF1902 domain-containing protein [Erysipelotrichaceae bacterium]|nr:DUF1902 domain-containing protein [Erysipelotrichaceae bacterium]
MGKEYVVRFFWDEEANVWVAINDEIPIALEDESFDKLLYKVRNAVPELVEMNRLSRPISLLVASERRMQIS